MNAIDALALLAKYESLNFRVDIEKKDHLFHYDNEKNVITLGVLTSRMPTLKNLVTISINVLAQKYWLLRNELRVKIFKTVFIYILIATAIGSIYQPWILINILIILWTGLIIVSTYEMIIRENFSKEVLIKLIDMKIVDKYEITQAKKIFRHWEVSALESYAEPFINLLPAMKRKSGE